VGKGGEMNLAKISYRQEEFMEEDHKYILIIGGIEIFLPRTPVEVRECVFDATIEEGQPTMTVIDEEEEDQTLTFAQAEGDENSVELLEIFSQEAEWEMVAVLELTEEEEEYNMDFVDLCEELESLERRVMVQSLHIQQAKLEADGGAYQP
jgi:hypothetical protein